MLKGFVLLLLAAAFAAPAAAGMRADGVWVDGAVHVLVTGPPPAGATHGRALYVIAPISTAHPLHPLADAKTHGFGAHDHVIALTHPNNTFHGACDLTLVVPGPKATPGETIKHDPRSPRPEPNRSSTPPDSTTSCSHSPPQPGSRPPNTSASSPDRHPQPRRLHRLTTRHRLVSRQPETSRSD